MYSSVIEANQVVSNTSRREMVVIHPREVNLERPAHGMRDVATYRGPAKIILLSVPGTGGWVKAALDMTEKRGGRGLAIELPTCRLRPVGAQGETPMALMGLVSSSGCASSSSSPPGLSPSWR